MELDRDQVAKAMAGGRKGKADHRKRDSENFNDKVRSLVAQGCGVGDITVAFPNMSDRET